MNLRSLIPYAVVASLAVGCGNGGDSKSSKVGIDDFKKLKAEACACKERKCAEAVDKKVDAAMTNVDPAADTSTMGGLLAEIGLCIAPLLMEK